MRFVAIVEAEEKSKCSEHEKMLFNVELGKGNDISENVEAFKRGLHLSLKTKKK